MITKGQEYTDIPRVQQVLHLIALGQTNWEVSDGLYLSVKTGETYKSRLMTKLGLAGRAARVRYALKWGPLEEPDRGRSAVQETKRRNVMSLSSFITLVHLLGLVLGVGAATAKLVLLVKSSTDRAFVPIYLRVARLITRQIIVGMVLLTLSGIGWLLVGYPFTPLLVVKLVLFGVIWVLGPVIDNLVEPRFQKLIPESDQPASPAFIAIQKRYLALEITATLLFYVVIVIWVVR